MKIDMPTLMNDTPTNAYIKANFPHAEKIGVVKNIARRLYVRTRLAEAQNWRCCWCGVKCRPEPGYKNSVTLEHVTPRSEGGSDERDNLAMACHACNSRRGSTDAEVFMRKQPWNSPTASMTRVERQQHKKLRKYVCRAKELKANGWVARSGVRIQNIDAWIDSLKLGEETVKILRAEAKI